VLYITLICTTVAELGAETGRISHTLLGLYTGMYFGTCKFPDFSVADYTCNLLFLNYRL